MKKIYFISLGLLAMLSCKTEEPTIVNCTPTTVKIVNGTEAIYTFTSGKLNTIDAARGTDDNIKYTYSYNQELINKISSVNLNGEELIYEASYSGTNLMTLTNYQEGTSLVAIEQRYIYNGNLVSSYETWVGNVEGTLFKVGHANFAYDSDGNLVQTEINFDFVAIFTLAFELNPTSYAPQTLVTFEYIPSNSPNPLFGSLAFNSPDFSIMKNLPASIKITDVDGNVTSETYEFDSDENGNTTNATGSEGSTLGAAYTCDQ